MLFRSAIGEQTQKVDGLFGSLDNMMETYDKDQKLREKRLKDMLKEIENLDSISDALKLGNKLLKEYLKNNKDLQVAWAAASGAVKGFGVSLKGLKVIGGLAFDSIKTLVGVVGELSMAIISAPFKMLEGLIGLAKQEIGRAHV